MSGELAQKLGREDANRLLKDRKLVLLVDLDQTLVHTTNDDLPPNLKVLNNNCFGIIMYNNYRNKGKKISSSTRFVDNIYI